MYLHKPFLSLFIYMCVYKLYYILYSIIRVQNLTCPVEFFHGDLRCHWLPPPPIVDSVKVMTPLQTIRAL